MDVRNGPPIQVHLVAPPLLCWGLLRLVQTAGPQFSLVATSPTLAQAQPLLDLMLPDVLVLDLDDGYTVDEITRLYERTRIKVLALTCSREEDFLQRVLAGGAWGVLHKREGPSALLKAIEAISHGQVFATHAALERPQLPAPVPALAPVGVDKVNRLNGAGGIASLTRRERQTLAAMTADASAPAKVVASRLCISEHTLRNRLTSIYSKLGVSGRLALYAFASEHQLRGDAGQARSA